MQIMETESRKVGTGVGGDGDLASSGIGGPVLQGEKSSGEGWP